MRPLPTRDGWLSFYLQLHPGMMWGLETVIISPNRLEKMIQSLYFQCLPLLGVNRHITKEWRMLPERYHGLGMPNYVVNCLSAKIFFMWRHWGFGGATGQMMTQAYEAFLVEVGLYGDVFTRDFKRYGMLATDGTWFKNLWELADHLKVSITMDSRYHIQPER